MKSASQSGRVDRWPDRHLTSALSLVMCAVAGCSGGIGNPGDGSDGGVLASPGPVLMRRLTNAEYNRTVRDLLGEPGYPSADFPADPKVVGFDNNAASLTIPSLSAERYRDAAERIGAAVAASPARRDRYIGCDLAGSDRTACLQSFVTSFGRRAFRRPLTTIEIQGLMHVADVAASDPDPYAVASMVIQAVLQSPTFLFRTEYGEPDISHHGWNRLHGYELASRLSFLLWGTTPDDALLDRAQNNVLETQAGLAATAREMLADPRAHEGLASFYAQWLRLYTLDSVHRDPTLFPAWNQALGNSMAEETSRLADDLIWRDGANFLDLLTARYTFVNAPLASLYGFAPPDGDSWARVDLSDSTSRGGLLTHASYLTLAAHSAGSTLIHRGKYVREVLLCQTLPSPPPGVPTIPEPVPGETELQRLQRHLSNPSCNGCHRLMDPIGLGMRRYDMIGAFIPQDAQMNPIPQDGTLFGYTPPTFDGPLNLGQRLRDMPDVSQCVVRQIFRYAFGRAEVMDTSDDLMAIQDLNSQFQRSHYSFRELLIALVSSDSFRYGQATTGGQQ